MPKCVVEREVPGVGASTSEQLHGISKKSCGVLQALDPEITWVTRYVTGDKIYCIQASRRHPRRRPRWPRSATPRRAARASADPDGANFSVDNVRALPDKSRGHS